MPHQGKSIFSWHTYTDHLRDMLKEMMTSNDFADVTLVCDDKKEIKAHRNILSACSPVFKNMLKIDQQSNHPVIYLRGIQHLERCKPFIPSRHIHSIIKHLVYYITLGIVKINIFEHFKKYLNSTNIFLETDNNFTQ